ncbi:MAG: hypothetical protein IKJ89_07160 [Kiritimatiellae bacterium]|nr:hypothetical protein [Kiritimatiellia bacterium]
MTKKSMVCVLPVVMLANFAQLAEMKEVYKAGIEYLTGRFEKQICELGTLAEKSPESGYSTKRIMSCRGLSPSLVRAKAEEIRPAANNPK